MKPTKQWVSKVENLLGDGWGVEDIALMLKCDVEPVRLVVKILREQGSLADLVNQGADQ